VGCNCGNKKQYEVVDAAGKRLFGPTPYKSTADAILQRQLDSGNAGVKVREVAR
jgi:hypothetical protein